MNLALEPVSALDMNQDPEPYLGIDGDFSRGLILLADHARNRLPDAYGTLGLPLSEFERHIAYDIGVEALTRRMSRILTVPAVLSGFSRLLIDPNRGEDDPTLIRQLYDGAIIAGNYPISDEERDIRLERWYRPYHRAVAEAVERTASQSGMPPLIIAIHSFTPRMQGYNRPWHISLLWDSDDRAKRLLHQALAKEDNLVIGDNEPYDGALKGDTMYQHATVNGYPHILIEIRQDLIADEPGQQEWADRLSRALDHVNRQPDIHRQQNFGSRSHR